MNTNSRPLSALMAVFPTADSYMQFAGHSENAKILKSLVAFAVSAGLIDLPEQGRLEELVRRHARSAEMCVPPGHLDFEDFFDQKEVLLELSLSARALTDRINALVKEYRIDLPKVSNSMLTRLKKEAADTIHKQNVLRSLAFWLGHDRAHMGPQWNVETLFKLCRGGKTQADHKEGVRIGFALYSRGDVIDHDIVGWLKKELKSYIDQSLGRFTYGRWGKVRSHDITTLYVDFPKESHLDNPAAYRQCLRSGLSLAHQMAIRWALSRHCTQNRFLSIGLAAGAFDKLDNYLLPSLNAKLPGDPTIRLTNYARQCILINDIRALLSNRPAEISLFNGETLTIWWVLSFWSTLYFDFIPHLLADPMLQRDSESVQRLTAKLWSALSNEAATDPEDRQDAITTLFRFPHNSLLGLEIAKTLYYRRRFWDALDILKIVLSLDPTHLNARTLRMVLLRNLAIDAPSYANAAGMFAQAYQEADFIQQNCAFQSEDFYCEYAVVYLAQAMTTLRHLRADGGAYLSEADVHRFKKSVFECLERADALFGMGIMLSPSGIRASYLLNTVKVLKSVLRFDDTLFHRECPIDCPPEVVLTPVGELQWQSGYFRYDLPEDRPYQIMENTMKLLAASHDDSIALQAYRPTTYYCTAVVWWDLFPVRTVACARRAVRLLQEAAEIAAAMAEKEICIYAFTRTYGEMIPAGDFIRHMENALQMIKEYAGDDLHRRDDHERIVAKAPDRYGLLMTLNF